MLSAWAHCPDDNQLVAFTAGTARGADASAIEAHMDGCPDCRVVLAELAHSSSVERTLADYAVDTATSAGDAYAAGQMLADRFCLLHRLGTGGMGEVYEAEDTLLGIPVAVKLLPRDGASPSLIGCLRQELLLGRRVSHPNVCRIYDLGKSGDVHFLTMELVQGDTLAERLARGPIGRDEAGPIIDQMVAALAAAHRAGVVHRDLKPGNIMVGAGGQVKVMDFGLARDHEWQASGRHGPVGTPGYWAPEQARGETATAASDVYSLGLVIAEMLSGERLHEARAEELRRIPRPFRRVVARCLAASPEDRFASALELENQLGRMAGACRRRRAQLATIVPGGFGVAAAALALCMMSGGPPPSPRDAGRRPAPARLTQRPLAPRAGLDAKPPAEPPRKVLQGPPDPGIPVVRPLSE